MRRLTTVVAVVVLACVISFAATNGQPAFAYASGYGSSGQVLADSLTEWLDIGGGALAATLLPATLLSLGLSSDQGPYIQTISFALHQCASDVRGDSGFPNWLSADFAGVGSWGSLFADGWDSACDPVAVLPFLYPASVIATEPWQGEFCASMQAWDGGGYWPPSSAASLSGTTWAWLTDGWAQGHMYVPNTSGGQTWALGSEAATTAQGVLDYLNAACPPAWLSFVYGSAYVVAGQSPYSPPSTGWGTWGPLNGSVVGSCDLDWNGTSISSGYVQAGVNCVTFLGGKGAIGTGTVEILYSGTESSPDGNNYYSGNAGTVAVGDSDQPSGCNTGTGSGCTAFDLVSATHMIAQVLDTVGGATRCPAGIFCANGSSSPYYPWVYQSGHAPQLIAFSNSEYSGSGSGAYVFYTIEQQTFNNVIPADPSSPTPAATSPAPAQAPPTAGSGTVTVSPPTGASGTPPVTIAPPGAPAPGSGVTQVSDQGDTNAIIGALTDGFDAVTGALSWLAGAVAGNLSQLSHDIGTYLSTDLGWLYDQLAPLLQGIWTAVVNVDQDLQSGLDTLHADLGVVAGLLAPGLQAVENVLHTDLGQLHTDLQGLQMTLNVGVDVIVEGATTTVNVALDAAGLATAIATDVGTQLTSLLEPDPAALQTDVGTLTNTWKATAPGQTLSYAAALPGALTPSDPGSEPCGPVIGFSAFTVLGQDMPGFQVYTPSPAPCPGNGPGGARTAYDDDASGLWGYRSLARGLEAFLMLWVFAWSVVGWAPWATKSEEAAPA